MGGIDVTLHPSSSPVHGAKGPSQAGSAASRPRRSAAAGVALEERRSSSEESSGAASGSSGASSQPCPLRLAKSQEKRSGAHDEIVHFAWKRGMHLDGRYELVKLLGDGTFGRVVLAQDKQMGRQVAIKIVRDVKRYRDNAVVEAEILMEIRRADPQGKAKCSIFYETFLHEGRFLCLVCEPLGASLYKALKQNAYRGFWLQDIQSFARQSLQGLAFLHQRLRMTHTDLKPENILLECTEAAKPSSFPRESFWKEIHKFQDSPRSPYMRPVDSRIKLIDFGNATYEHDRHSCIINTRQYRSPEVVLEAGWDENSDLWSMGCIFMELYTGDLLFNTHESLEHLALMEKIMHPIPPAILAQASPHAKKAYMLPPEGSRAHWQLNWPQGATSRVSERHVYEQRPLWTHTLRHHKPLVALVSWLLTVDRKERPSAMEALRHPFFNETFSD